MNILDELQKLATSFYKNVIVLSLLLLSSCKATHYSLPNLPLPNSWNNYSLASQNNQISRWWLQFNDPVLNNLIEESLANNSDIELAMSNVAIATAQYNLVNSYRFPQINLQGSVNRTKTSKQLKQPNQPKISNNFGLGSVLNYEIDLWGLAANASESARRTL